MVNLLKYDNKVDYCQNLFIENKVMTQKEIGDIMEVCPWRERPLGDGYVCARYVGTYFPCDGRCGWVVDYPRLKELENNINKRK